MNSVLWTRLQALKRREKMSWWQVAPKTLECPSQCCCTAIASTKGLEVRKNLSQKLFTLSPAVVWELFVRVSQHQQCHRITFVWRKFGFLWLVCSFYQGVNECLNEPTPFFFSFLPRNRKKALVFRRIWQFGLKMKETPIKTRCNTCGLFVCFLNK